MADNKNMALNDEAMAGAVGGEEDERGRIENATVIGPFGDNQSQTDCYSIRRDGQSSDDVAHYDAIRIIEPGTRVKVELVGMGRWQIVDFM